MAVGWSGWPDDEPDHPDHTYIVAAVAVDPADPSGVAVALVPMEPVPYADPDGLTEPGVIEPTQVFKPWLRGDYWRNVTITHEEFE
jgi:hypothetical protein